jgi:tRNA 2-selenouridine synthase SelU
MEKKEYYKRIERINNRFKAGRVSVDESYQLICQRNYLSTKYIKNLEQQVKKQKEVIDKVNKLINHYLKNTDESGSYVETNTRWKLIPEILKELLDILKEVSE